MKRAVFWDLDGVIIDSLSFDIECLPEVLSSVVQSEISIDEDVIRKHFYLDHQRFIKAVLLDTGITLSDEQFLRALQEFEDQRAIFPYKVHDGARDLIKSVSYTQCVVSSNKEALIRHILRRLNLEQYFTFIIGFDSNNPFTGEMGLRKKPDPEMYKAAFALTGAKEAWAIEDSAGGAKAAFDAGCEVVCVTTGGSTKEELSQFGDVFGSLLGVKENVGANWISS